jgi:hypothetical protein
MPICLPPLSPPNHEAPVRVPHYASKGFADLAERPLVFDQWELAWFRAMHPSQPNLLFNSNGNGSRYPRFCEIMPDGRHARHDLARYLQATRDYLAERCGGPPAVPCGPPIGLIDGDCTNLLPSNRRATNGTYRGGDGVVRNARRGYDASWSVRIRIDALLRGDDPDEVFGAERKRLTAKRKPNGGAKR